MHVDSRTAPSGGICCNPLSRDNCRRLPEGTLHGDVALHKGHSCGVQREEGPSRRVLQMKARRREPGSNQTSSSRLRRLVAVPKLRSRQSYPCVKASLRHPTQMSEISTSECDVSQSASGNAEAGARQTGDLALLAQIWVHSSPAGVASQHFHLHSLHSSHAAPI